MKQMSRGLFFVLLLSSAVGLISAPIEPTRTAYVRVQKIFSRENLDEGAHEWRDGVKKINEYFINEANKIKAENDKGEKLSEEYEKKKHLMDPETSRKKERDLIDLKNKIERDKQDLSEIRAHQAQSLQEKLITKTEKTIGEFAEKQGWDLVMVTGALYVSKRVDITDEILALLNKEYDAQKAKESTTASKPTPATKPAETKK